MEDIHMLDRLSIILLSAFGGYFAFESIKDFTTGQYMSSLLDLIIATLDFYLSYREIKKLQNK